jgi:hypothetical protein
LPHDQAADWFGISRDTIRTGLKELRQYNLLDLIETRYIPSLVSPTGWTPRHYYELRDPFLKTDHQAEPGTAKNPAAS